MVGGAWVGAEVAYGPDLPPDWYVAVVVGAGAAGDGRDGAALAQATDATNIASTNSPGRTSFFISISPSG